MTSWHGRGDILSYFFRQIDAYIALWYASFPFVDDMVSCQGRHHVMPGMTCCQNIVFDCAGPGSFGWSLPILQFYVCVGQSGRIQPIDVAHVGGLV